MPRYIYEAQDQDGNLVRDSIETDSLATATHELESRQLQVNSIRADEYTRAHSLDEKLASVVQNRVDIADKITAFASELPKSSPRSSLLQLAKRLRNDLTVQQLKDSHAQHVPLLLTTESDLHLVRAFEHIAHQTDLGARRRGAWIYPLVVWICAFIVLVGLCQFVIPIFSEMFREFGMHLPAATQFLVGLSDWINESPHYFWSTVAGIVLVSISGAWIFRRLDLAKLLFGYTSASRRNDDLANLTCYLSCLMDIGFSCAEALPIASWSARKSSLAGATSVLSRAAVLGQSPPTGILPPNVLLAMGMDTDQSPPNSALMQSLSELYRDRVVGQVRWLADLLTTLSIICLGVMIGFIVLALFAPLVSLVSALS